MLRSEELLVPAIADIAVLSVNVNIEIVRVEAQRTTAGAACLGFVGPDRPGSTAPACGFPPARRASADVSCSSYGFGGSGAATPRAPAGPSWNRYPASPRRHGQRAERLRSTVKTNDEGRRIGNGLKRVRHAFTGGQPALLVMRNGEIVEARSVRTSPSSTRTTASNNAPDQAREQPTTGTKTRARVLRTNSASNPRHTARNSTSTSHPFATRAWQQKPTSVKPPDPGRRRAGTLRAAPWRPSRPPPVRCSPCSTRTRRSWTRTTASGRPERQELTTAARYFAWCVSARFSQRP